LALIAAGITLENQRGRGTTRPTAALTSAPLKPISAPPHAGGKVTIARSDGQVIVDIHISGLPSPGPNRFYEAWLFDPATNKMMAMGVLPPAASTTFEVAGELLHDYSALDISLQANNGNPAHSATSVLRATQI
jgi:Anti-sigma-K factor rskA, C-terminal